MDPGWYAVTYHYGSSSVFAPITYDSDLYVAGIRIAYQKLVHSSANYIKFYIDLSDTGNVPTDFARTITSRRFLDLSTGNTWSAGVEVEIQASP